MLEGTDSDANAKSSEEEINLVNNDGNWGQGDKLQDGGNNSSAVQAHPGQSYSTATGAPSGVS
jgi:hypothetical protein